MLSRKQNHHYKRKLVEARLGEHNVKINYFE